jgi:hypothetical protein
MRIQRRSIFAAGKNFRVVSGNELRLPARIESAPVKA